MRDYRFSLGKMWMLHLVASSYKRTVKKLGIYWMSQDRLKNGMEKTGTRSQKAETKDATPSLEA